MNIVYIVFFKAVNRNDSVSYFRFPRCRYIHVSLMQSVFCQSTEMPMKLFIYPILFSNFLIPALFPLLISRVLPITLYSFLCIILLPEFLLMSTLPTLFFFLTHSLLTPFHKENVLVHSHQFSHFFFLPDFWVFLWTTLGRVWSCLQRRILCIYFRVFSIQFCYSTVLL